MKRWKIVVIVAVCVVLLLNLAGFGRKPLFGIFVEKVELHTDSHSYRPGKREAELTWMEALKVIALYNFSRYEKEINAEPCCAAYWLEIHLRSGKVIQVSEGSKNKVIVEPVLGERYYRCNGALVNYILQLAEQYELVYD